MLDKDIKQSLDLIWANPNYREFTKDSYLFQKKSNRSSLKFIGLNESIEERRKFNPSSFAIEKQNYLVEKFNEISKVCLGKWEQIDLLYLFNTEESLIKNILQNPKGIDFINEQLKITSNFLTVSFTKAIIILNEIASQNPFTGKHLNRDAWLWHQMHYNSEIECFFVDIWKTGVVPIFFTKIGDKNRTNDAEIIKIKEKIRKAEILMVEKEIIDEKKE